MPNSNSSRICKSDPFSFFGKPTCSAYTHSSTVHSAVSSCEPANKPISAEELQTLQPLRQVSVQKSTELSMLCNRRDHWAEGGLSGDRFSQFDLHLGSHGYSSVEVTASDQSFGDIQESWSPAYSIPTSSESTSPFADWTSTPDPTEQQFTGSPTYSNHWDLTLTGK